MLRILFWLSFVAGITCAASPTLAQEIELLENRNFDTDLSGWLLPSHSSRILSWSMEDVDGDQASGSVRWDATSSTASWAITQCVNLAPGPITASAWTLVPTEQADAPTPRLILSIYTERDCAAGSRSGTKRTDPVLVEGVWTLMATGSTATAGIRSARIELALWLSADPEATSTAFFDAVSLVPEPGSVQMSATVLLVIASLAAKRRTETKN